MDRLYRLLIALYPPDFRRRFGRVMLDDFRELRTAEGNVRALGRALRDLLRSLPAAWGRAARGAGGGAGPSFGGARGVLRDLRFGLRGLRRDPGFAVPALAVLALAIGVGAAVAGVVNAYLVRPLPFPESERLVALNPVLPLTLEEAREALEIPLTWELDAFTLLGDDRPEQVLGSWVTPGFFSAYGITPALGRPFHDHEWGEGAPAVAILSWGLWQRRFGGDPDILGTAVRTYSSDRPDEAEVFTVVGVFPRDLWLHRGFTDFVVPIRQLNRIYEGRVRADLPLDRAEEILTELARGRTADLEGDTEVTLTRVAERYAERVRPTLVLLAATVGVVLLIACGNVALLFLVRVQRRGRELAVRRALGASRGTVAAQLVVEGVLLAAAAGVLGVLVAAFALRALGTVVPRRLGLDVPGGVAALSLDGTVLGVVAGVCVLMGLAFGILPQLVPSESRLLSTHGRDGGGRRQRRMQDLVMIGELALSLALLVAAGLSVRSARHLESTDLGFDPEGLSIATLMLRERSYPDADARLDFQRRLQDALGALPGLASTGLGLRTPIGRGYAPRVIETEEREVRAIPQYAAPEYFATLGLTPLRGRMFGPDDVPGSPEVALVSDDLARTLWPGEEALGKRFREVWEGEDLPWRTVVGVVPAVQQDPMAEPTGDYYFPLSQEAPRFFTLYLRTRTGTALPLAALERAVAELDPEVAVAEVRDVGLVARDITGPGRFLAFLLTVFGGFAVVLALLGLYGTVAYAAAQRRFEVAVRMALGAQRGEVSGLFLRERWGVLLLGLGLGVGAALLVARLLADQLRGVGPTDLPTYAGACAVLLLAALAAVYIPARHAARTDPMRVLREE